MKLELFTLCDAATADHSGKLNLLGAFDTLFARQAPLTHPSCAVALRMRFDPAEDGTHSLELRFVDSDGKPLLQPMKAPITIVASPDTRTHSRNFIVNFQQLRLPAFGEYRIDLFFDGQAVSTHPLYAIQPKQ